MSEWMITSSALILLMISLRRVLRGKMSLRLQYALWGVVLVRLLVPFSLFESSFSLMNVVEDISGIKLSQTADGIGSNIEGLQFVPGYSVSPTDGVEAVGGPGRIEGYYSGDSDRNFPTVILPESSTEEFERLEKAIKVRDVLVPIWLIGAAGVLGFFVLCNLRFRGKLRRSRRELEVPGSIIPVYVSGAVETPCLFGFFRPAVYVTADCEGDARTLRHVLAHETTHYRHGDNVWSALRCVALALHWYNPLVWYAAVQSKRDAELACDEGVLSRLGDGERGDYGRTLIGLTCSRGDFGSLALTSTTMTGSAKSIKERIGFIASRPKMAVYTALAVLLIAALAVGCTFSGATRAMTDDELISMAYEDALSTAQVNGVNISAKGVLTRGEGEVEILLPVLVPTDKSADHIKVTYAMVDESGRETKKPFSASIEYVSASKDPISHHGIISYERDALDGIAMTAIDFIIRHIESSIEDYESSGTHIIEARLTGLEQIATGTVDENGTGVNMYRIEYRLLPEDPDSVILAGGMKMENGWITEWSSAGQPLLMCYVNNGLSASFCSIIWTLTVEEEYSSDAMTEKYGNAYTAACMEYYHELVNENEYFYLVMMQTDCPAFVSTASNSVAPYMKLKHSKTWDEENGWLMGDGTPLAAALEDADKIPVITYDGSLQIEVRNGYSASPALYDLEFNPLSFGNGRTVTPGEYYFVFPLMGVQSEFVESENAYNETAYDCIVKLYVGEDTPAREILNSDSNDAFFYFTGDPESLVELYAREIHAKQLLAVEGDYAITDYKLVDCELYAERVDGMQIVGSMIYAVSPENPDLPDWWAGNTDMGKGEYEGMLTMGRQFTLESRGEGYWECTDMGTGGAGGWGFVWNWTPEEALINTMTCLEESGTDKTLVLWGLPLINFADMDTDDFFALMDAVEEVCVGEGIVYGPEEWRTWEQVYPDDQFYRNLYCMKGALNCDGAYSARMQYILNKQYHHDPELFSRCLQYFTLEQQDMLMSLADDDFV